MLHLSRNLESLRLHRPAVAALLEPFVAQKQYRLYRTPAGAVSIANLQDASNPKEAYTMTPGGEPAEALPRMLMGVDRHVSAGDPIAVLGFADGYLIGALARTPPKLFMDMQQCVYLVEPDPALAVACLSLHDYTGPAGPIEQQRFQWCIGADWGRQMRDHLMSQLHLPMPIALVKQSPAARELEEELNSLIRGRLSFESELQRRVNAYYATLSADRLARLLGKSPPRPPRALFITSRFTTVLQYSARDAAYAFEQMGFQTRTMLEPTTHSRCMQGWLLAELDAFKPDLMFALDHLRRSTGPVVPEQLPHLAWVQDLLPHLLNRDAGASVGARDFVLTFAGPMLTADFGYPARQCIDVPMMLASPVSEPATPTGPEPTADLVYVSNCAGKIEDLVERVIARTEGSMREVAELACRWLVDLYASGGSAPSKHDLRCGIDRIADMSPSLRRQLVEAMWNPLNTALYKQQGLRWCAESARELGLTLAVYGRDWEKHPEFAPLARGVVEPGADLEALIRGAAINLNLEPYACVTHNRLLTGLAAGGFYLIRSHPMNTLIPELASALHGGAVELNLLEQARCLCFGDHDDPVEQVRAYERAGVVVAGQPLLPRLDEVSFGDAAACRNRIERFMRSPELRRSIVTEQREMVMSRLTVTEGMKRALARVRERLCEEASASSPLALTGAA